MKTIKLIIFISSILLAMSINTRGVYFSYISEVYASEKTIKKISDIKSVTLIIRSCLLVDDLSNCGGSLGPCPHTIRGIVIFEDKDGKQCAVDYDGIAELSCKFFNKQFRIDPGDFKKTTYPDGNERYAYPIREFKLTFEEAPTLFRRPYETVKFKLENLEDTCELSPNGGSEGESDWILYKGKK